MLTAGIGNLSTLIKRLEAATSRLEDIAVGRASEDTDATVENMERPRGENMPSASCMQLQETREAQAPTVAPTVAAWDAQVVPALDKFMQLSAQIGGNIQQQAERVHTAFASTRDAIMMAGICQRPAEGAASPVFMERLKPLQEKLMSVATFRDTNRGDKHMFNQMSTISEGIPALGWVAVEPTPVPYIGDMKESAEFYANRVIKEKKDTDPVQVEWTRAFLGLLTEMQAYVKQNHATGLTWNKDGVSLASYNVQETPAAPAPLAAAPALSGGMDALFGQINKGEGITGALRKVDPSQMTHKNSALRADNHAPPPKPQVTTKPTSFRQKKPPVKQLEGNKWIIENYENEKIVIDDTALSHTVTIVGCEACVIEVQGKVNAISLLSCRKTSVLIDSLVSSLEVTRCASFTAQINGSTPTVLLDNVDGAQIYLSEQGMQTEVVTAKSSALNFSVPVPGIPGEYEELALPEQIKHSFARAGDKAKATSIVVHHAG